MLNKDLVIPSLKEILLDLVVEQEKISPDRLIRKIKPQERICVCKCGHLFRYHIKSGGIFVCKYSLKGTCKCKGYIPKDLYKKETV